MKKYVIERDIPGAGNMSTQDLAAASRKSNDALAELAPFIQWQHSYVAGDKTFCIYLAKDETTILEHARRSGFPANSITEVACEIDPTTENSKGA
ncbi:DUF4242 domain-containing protein [Labrenzia sp. PO1]|uniref:DUF4242 domain-containing protein n=1 Tax=Labrenzia sp. PO1 TaxID=2720390 RepID=UPI0014450913|nr:DUF4242 domain-containing protein [Labrenzia sp. PO1]NKI60432.1 DUF4242 domain-containing protein [Labrenzia sp. PO1]